MIAAQMAMKSTALAGTRLVLTFLHTRQPGIAPSREKAKHMREALVRHAAPQNSCPTVEMIRTSLTQAADIAVLRIAIDTYWPAAACSLMPLMSVAAKVSASSTIQPKI